MPDGKTTGHTQASRQDNYFFPKPSNIHDLRPPPQDHTHPLSPTPWLTQYRKQRWNEYYRRLGGGSQTRGEGQCYNLVDSGDKIPALEHSGLPVSGDRIGATRDDYGRSHHHLPRQGPGTFVSVQ
ncbi:hypothetical protein NDU88_003124 [Pleurodeles waltl]|uniref:Uncharacterized protein n=1 Tax=Pleurodeles waltl TaxID=8319 RepID=A0AAV7MA50_PLEWA|nr:hypothetical protein NDU88_003124 [Pleurodeles waltl]